MEGTPTRLALRASLIYALFGGLWILTSDQLLRALVRDPAAITRVSMYKGWLFVAATAALLFSATRAQLARWSAEVARRERAEAARLAEAVRMRTYVDHAPMGVIVSDLEGRLVDVNPAGRALLGLAPDAPLDALSIFDFALADEGHIARDRFAQLLSAGRVEEDMPLRRADGEAVWAHLRAVKIGDERCLAYAYDITARRADAELLRKMSQAVTRGTTAIMITDTAGRIEYVNPRFTATSGYTFEEVRGKTPRLLHSGATSPDEYLAMRQMLQRGEVWRGEFQNRRKDGSLYWERASIAPIEDDLGHITHYLAIKDDVTEHKRLEAQFLQAQKMEAIGTLAGGIAHDFNNVLTVILSGAAILALPDTEPGEVPELATQIQDAAERAAKLTRQLLLFSRKQAMRPVALDLNRVVTDLARMLRRIVGEDVTVEVRAAASLPAVRGDPGMLEQVLMNLAVNARDAMPSGGRISVSTSAEALSDDDAQRLGAAAGPYAVLAVTDTGSGIAASVMPHIFEPFYTTKEVGRGTGLGLATVYGIVRQHRGWIDVDSEVGRGTTFRVGLPAATGEVDAEPAAASALQRGRGTVLLVEDDAAVRAGMARTLRQCGYSVLEASNGAEALRVHGAHQGRLSLLVTDLVMPERLGGVELARALRESDPALRVLYTSGYDAHASLPEFDVHHDSFLQKPFGATRLAEAVLRAMS